MSDDIVNFVLFGPFLSFADKRRSQSLLLLLYTQDQEHYGWRYFGRKTLVFFNELFLIIVPSPCRGIFGSWLSSWPPPPPPFSTFLHWSPPSGNLEIHLFLLKFWNTPLEFQLLLLYPLEFSINIFFNKGVTDLFWKSHTIARLV